MTNQESLDNEALDRKLGVELVDPTDKPEAKPTRKHAKVEEEGARLKADLSAAQKALTAAQAEVELERQKRNAVEKALREAQQSLAADRLEVEQERQVQMGAEKVRILSGQPLKATPVIANAAEENVESPPVPLGEGSANPRISFIVRLVVDEHGQPGRGEIEHEPSNRLHRFRKLDGDDLVTFMKECISQATGGPSVSELPELASSVAIVNVQAFHLGAPNVNAPVFDLGEDFDVTASFRLQGSEVRSLTTQGHSYEMTVKVIEVTGGKSILSKACGGKLIQNEFEYTPEVRIPGLSPGTYRLFTQVILDTPNKIAGYYDKAVIEVH
jgi:hypothetical protein